MVYTIICHTKYPIEHYYCFHFYNYTALHKVSHADDFAKWLETFQKYLYYLLQKCCTHKQWEPRFLCHRQCCVLHACQYLYYFTSVTRN